MTDSPDQQPAAPAARPRYRWLRRLLLGIGITLAVLLCVAGLLYGFGSMQSPTPDMVAAYAGQVAAGQAPELADRFHIPIPGCVCHSPDPRLQMEHRTRYLRECSECH